MQIKKLTALLLACGMAAALFACSDKDPTPASSASEPEDPNYPVAIEDIRIRERPERIVSLSPATTELLYELGGEDRLMGVSDFCNYPPQAADKIRCGSPQLPNLDELDSIRPDVVFASAALSQQDTVALQQMDAQVVILPRADSIEGMRENYITAATILDGKLDGKANGQRIFTRLQQRFDALEAAAQSVSERPSAIFLRLTPLVMATGDTFEGELLELLGMDNAAKEFTGWAYPEDKAVDLYPDIIFYDQSIDPQYLKDTKIYNTTDAVKQGRIYAVDSTAFERQSEQMLTQLEDMFRAAHPNVPLDAPESPDQSEHSNTSSESTSSLSGIIEEPR